MYNDHLYQLIRNLLQQNLFKQKHYSSHRLDSKSPCYLLPSGHIHCISMPFIVEGIGLHTPPLAHVTFTQLFGANT